jgi:hypothetical protein
MTKPTTALLAEGEVTVEAALEVVAVDMVNTREERLLEVLEVLEVVAARESEVAVEVTLGIEVVVPFAR